MKQCLLSPGIGRISASEHWFFCKDADPDARALFHRHYSRYIYKDGRIPAKFVGPGQHIVLITMDGDALFVWRKFIDDSGQRGVNCSIFRNESDHLSSALIIEAELVAWRKWPGERLYTYVNPRLIRSSNPGACFKKAGWKECGITKSRKLVILEKLHFHENAIHNTTDPKSSKTIFMQGWNTQVQ